MIPLLIDDEYAPATEQPAKDEPSTEKEPTAEMIEAEIELIDSVYESYRRYLEASKEAAAASQAVREAERELDQCKEEVAGRRERLDEKLKSLPEKLLEIRDPTARSLIESIQEEMESHEEAKPDSDISESDYQAWREISTQVIIDAKIPGLGTKKQEQLLEQFPTIGHLEDARTEASKEHCHLAKKLPKGFGDTTADAIEKLMSDLLIKGRSESNPATAKPSAETSVDTKTEEGPKAEPVQETKTETPVETIVETSQEEGPVDESQPEPELELDEDDTDDIYSSVDDDEEYEDLEEFDDSDPVIDSEPIDSATLALQTVELLESDPEERNSGWGVDDSEHPKAWQQGWDAQPEWDVDALPYDFEEHPENAMQWIRGWLARKHDIDL